MKRRRNIDALGLLLKGADCSDRINQYNRIASQVSMWKRSAELLRRSAW